jgi:hypothetical protein
MARYRVQGPDGKVHVFEGPDGATPADVEAFAAATFGKKERPAATGFDPAKVDPTEGMSTVDKVRAGIGSGMASVARAVGGGRAVEALGLPGTKEEGEQLDAPLAKTGAGKLGQVLGVAAPAALAVPFTPLTYGGAAAAGALTGGLMTEGDLGDRAAGAGMGAAGGLIGQALPAVVRTGSAVLKGLTEPFLRGGRERIAGRTLQRFATDENALQGLTNAPTLTGARPTLAEATGDTGLATLERAVGTMDPEAAQLLRARAEANNAARLEALRAVSGGATQPASRVRRLNQISTGQPTREAAEATRSAAAARSYGEAFDAGVDPDMAYALAPQLNSILERPSVRAGITRARGMAQEAGVAIDDPGSVQGLHYLKQALDDQVGRLRDQPARQRLVQQTSQDLASVLEEIAPLYQTARREFQNNSVPVNRAAIGERLVERASGALRDSSGNRRLQANAFAKALNDEGDLIRQATGFRGGPQSLEDVLTPSQMGRVSAVRDELEQVANLSQAANGPGSQTAKMLASQNLLRQIAGPMGLPDSFVENAVSQTLLRPIQFGMNAAEPRIQEAIARGLLDPEEALRMIQAARTSDAVTPANALQLLLRRSAPAAIGGLSAYGAGQ